MNFHERIDNLSPEARETYRGNWAAFQDLADRYWSDAALKARIDSGDVSEALSDLGLNVPPGIKVRIVAERPEVHYLVLPADPNTELSDEALAAVAGGKTAGTAASTGTASTVACSTVGSSVGTAGSASTYGSAS